MSAPEPDNGNFNSANLQRLAVGAGTLLVVVLTVVAAIFLTLRDIPENEPTPIVGVSPSPSLPVVTRTVSPTPPPPLPTGTVSFTLTPTLSPTLIPPVSPTPVPPTATPVPPTATPTLPPPPPATFTPQPPVVIVVTPTPQPAPPPVNPTSATGPAAVCQAPADWVTYQVQLGDTLNSLARRTNTSVFELQQVNCLESYTLQIGQVIHLPFTPPTPTVTYTPTPRTPTPTPTRTGTPTGTPRPPEIFSNFPESGVNTGEVIIAVQGRNFQADDADFRAELRTGGTKVPLQLSNLRTSTSFEAIVPANLATGTYDLWVINPDDQFDIRSSAYQALSP